MNLPKSWPGPYQRGPTFRVPSFGELSSDSIIVLRLLRKEWPVFAWANSTVDNTLSREDQMVLDRLFPFMRLTIATLKDRFDAAEEKMRSFAYRVQIDDDQKHFAELLSFRQFLAQNYSALAKSRKYFQTMQYLFKSAMPKHGILPDKMQSAPATADPPNLAKLLEDDMDALQERLDAIKEDLNEEIQVAIGTVQVHDAQIMREQTKVTVVLAVLAAVYLPMTLVTGIFGMNITEISSEATAPSAWSVVVAWVVTLGLTAIGIGTYIVVKRRRVQTKSDVEAGAGGMSDNTRSKARAMGSDKGLGKGGRKWGRKVKQKAKKAWSRKKE